MSDLTPGERVMAKLAAMEAAKGPQPCRCWAVGYYEHTYGLDSSHCCMRPGATCHELEGQHILTHGVPPQEAGAA